MRALVFCLALVASPAWAGPGQFTPETPKGAAPLVATLKVSANIPGVTMHVAIGTVTPQVLTCVLPCTLTIPHRVGIATKFTPPAGGYAYDGKAPPIAWTCSGVMPRKCVLAPDAIEVHFVKHPSETLATTDKYPAPLTP